MRTDTISPLVHPLIGHARVPGDKSISHRCVLFASMAEGTSRLTGLLDSDDVNSSIKAVSALGAQVDISKQEDGSLSGTITGWGAKGPASPGEPIDCGNSGTTTRLLMGILSSYDVKATLIGDESLQRRPMARVTRPLTSMGARFSPEGRDTLPLTVQGTANPRALGYRTPVASAQLKTAILLAGLRAEGTTCVDEPAYSRDHTELMLPGFGVEVESWPCHAALRGPVMLHSCDVDVPGDPSSAAFLICAALLKEGSEVVVERVSLNPARIGFVRVLQRMGAEVSSFVEGCCGKEPYGSMSARYSEDPRAVSVEADEIASLVDEVPVLALVAGRAKGTTVFHEIGELRIKESDRVSAMVDVLTSLGIRSWIDGEDFYIEGNPDAAMPSGLHFDSLHDHRLAMVMAMTALCGDESVLIDDFEAVSVSYPDFLRDIHDLSKE